MELQVAVDGETFILSRIVNLNLFSWLGLSSIVDVVEISPIFILEVKQRLGDYVDTFGNNAPSMKPFLQLVQLPLGFSSVNQGRTLHKYLVINQVVPWFCQSVPVKKLSHFIISIFAVIVLPVVIVFVLLCLKVVLDDNQRRVFLHCKH